MLETERRYGALQRSYRFTEDAPHGYPEVVLDTEDFALITGTSNIPLAKKIGAHLGEEIQETAKTFADGETRIRIPSNIRRKDVFVVQPTNPPVNNSVMELFLMIDAAKRASASEITAIVPYFGYSRQDRKDISRVPISASRIAKMIEFSGANRILTLDIHSEQQEGYIDGAWDNLYGSISLIPELQNKKLNDLVVASPDKGGVQRATAYAKRLNAEGVAIVYKERDVNTMNQSEALDSIGDVDGANVLIVDDIIDTAGTVVKAADLLTKRGAKSISVAATHGLFSADAINKINDSKIEEVMVTDSIALNEDVLRSPKIQVVSIAPLMAEAIKRIYVGESLSDLII